MKPEQKHILLRVIVRSLITQPAIMCVVTPYYMFVLNFTWDQITTWLITSQPFSIAISLTAFAWLELLVRSERIRKLIE